MGLLLLLLSLSIVSGVAEETPSGIAKVYGYARYWESSEKIGYIRYARVELWEDTYIDNLLATTNTDLEGYYEFNISLTGSKNVYAKINCESFVAVVTYGLFDSRYWERTPTQTALEGETTFLGVYYAPIQEVWWHAFDYATQEHIWIRDQVNWIRPQVQIKYPSGNHPTSYGDVIELPDINNYPWGRATVYHEYAHCVMCTLYGGFPPGSCSDTCECPQGKHYVNSVADSGFAFKEGWAVFMQCAVDGDPRNMATHNLGDVDGDGTQNYYYTTIEDNRYAVGGRTYKWYHGRCFSPGHDGNCVEGAAAGILWDMFDPANDDRLSMGFYPIWYILSTYEPQSMTAFWDHWVNTYGQKKELCAIYSDHGITTLGMTESLFYSTSFFVAGDRAYCTDVLGSAKIAFGLAKGGAYENPEGRTDIILTSAEHDNGNLMPVGGPAVNPVATEFDEYMGITYTHIENSYFAIHCEGYTIALDVANTYPYEDICIVYVGQENSRNVLQVWGYGWRGTYAGSVFMGNPQNWQVYSNCHMLMLRWRDFNGDGLVQVNEISVETVK